MVDIINIDCRVTFIAVLQSSYSTLIGCPLYEYLGNVA